MESRIEIQLIKQYEELRALQLASNLQSDLLHESKQTLHIDEPTSITVQILVDDRDERSQSLLVRHRRGIDFICVMSAHRTQAPSNPVGCGLTMTCGTS